MPQKYTQNPQHVDSHTIKEGTETWKVLYSFVPLSNGKLQKKNKDGAVD